MNFNFNFIPTINSPVGTGLSSVLDNSSNLDYLANLGAPYKSWILNHLSLMTIILFLIIIHLLLLIPKLCIHKVRFILVVNFYNKVIQILTFSIYVRLVVEAYQAILVSNLTEINNFNKSDTSHRVSLSFAFVIAFSCVVVAASSAIEWYRSRNEETFKNQTYFREIFEGLKDRWIWRWYIFVNLLRRIFFISISVFNSSSLFGTLVPFNIIQISYLIFVWIVRPLESK